MLYSEKINDLLDEAQLQEPRKGKQTQLAYHYCGNIFFIIDKG